LDVVKPRRRPVFRLLGCPAAGVVLLLPLALWPEKLVRSFGGTIRGERLDRLRRSPHWRDGKFLNPVPSHTMKPDALGETLRRQFFGDEKRVPDQPIPIVPLTKAELTKPEEGLRATWMGHSTVLVDIDGMRVLTDPIWSERCSPFQWAGPKRFFPAPAALSDVEGVDAVVISHDHYDHLDMATVIALARAGAHIVVPLGIGAHLERWNIPQSQFTELDWGEQKRIGALTFTSIRGRHFSGRGLRHGDATQWASWSIAGSAHRVFYSGDTGWFDGMIDQGVRYGPFDLTLIKIGAYGETWPDIHVNPEQAVQLHKAMRGNVLLPVHWATFNLAYHDWWEPGDRIVAASQGITLTTPRPGEMVDLAKELPASRWWR
jgi:L-ascorbate metabolism protein UlaG (beta-lactamase superfamily)